ncbi:unnamed protein product [Diatraea saccharalis]|uniref:Endothelin-converting enzyme 1 n=1 Tax=Diatraea saccharalis TaxID=40085 RepID=A0A9P0FZQ4_9NEOP|nr:unnamed protein product [Diatraea saccharalis]
MEASTPEIIPAQSDTPEDTPSPSPGPQNMTKFNWLKHSRRNNPFVKSRPSLTRDNSSADLVSRQSSSSDFFQNSRMNLFETLPKPEGQNQGYMKGVSFIGWHQRTKLERVLLVTTAVLFLGILLTATLFLTTRGTAYLPVPPCYQPETKDASVCLSSSCIYTASEVIRALDTNQDPCDDFYEFACGGWIRNNPIPEGKSTWGIFSKIELQNQLIIRYALEKVNVTDGGAEAKARIYYDACIDTNETIEKMGEKPLLSVIKELGGWHILPSTTVQHHKWNLQSLLQDVQNTYNLGGLFNWAVTEDDRNSSVHVIVLDQGGLNLPTRDNYLNKTAHKKVLDAYLDYMTRICMLLGANKTEARIQMSRVIQFETELANITTPSEDRRDEEGLYNPYTIRQWQKEAPFLNWTLFFNNAFSLVNRSISDTERIVVYAPDYFRNLTKVIAKYSKTEEDKRTLTSYMMWQVSRSLSTYLSKSFRDATKILRKALFGSEGTEESWRYCVTDTNNAIGFAVGAMFVREVFHGEAKTQGEIMIDNIRSAFKRNLEHLDWMDSETRNAAEVKADAITDMIGFPDYILHKEELDKQYEGLEVKPNEYFQNNIAFNKFSLTNDLKKLDQPVNKTKWGMTPSTVNAYYTPTKNQIVFPAGILQLPFYDGDNPKSVNYGAMGVVMGHELTHAFDDQGREYDRFGNLNQWWNNATIGRFKKRAECIQKQYSDYKMEGQHLNGKQTLGENIADNGGLKAAFHAYLDYSKTARVNVTLPGLNYNHRQLFFISFAQVWCSAMTKESTKMQIEKDDHTIAKYRVIGPISNLKEFSNEFGCSIGTKMNPEHKCEVW